MHEEKEQLYNKMDECLHEMQANLTKINSGVDSTDFFEKMVELARAQPEAYDLIQAMILLFSKIETSTKQFHEAMHEILSANIKIKQKTLEVVKDHSTEINLIRRELKNTSQKKSLFARFAEAFLNWISNVKNFSIFFAVIMSILLFFSIYLLGKFDKAHFQESVNNTLHIIKGEGFKRGPKDENNSKTN